VIPGVVGTPAGFMDSHAAGKRLDLLRTFRSLVLDEGDEMLRWAFIDDVEC